MLKNILIILVALLAGFALFHNRAVLADNAKNMMAATFFIPSVTANELQDKYKNFEKTGRKVKVIIVPGHEPDYGGAEFGDLKERDMTVALALILKQELESDKHFEVILTRDKGGWNPDLKKYFDENWQAIKDFTSLKKQEMRAVMTNGTLKKVTTGIIHNKTAADVGYRLFGINRWSRDLGADLLIHIHFNDYPRSKMYTAGEYKGFAIYIPDKQYSNAVATKEIAQSVFDSLSESFAVSDLPKEDDGIVESQDLIAIGQANSLDAASLLIEYGYIYRPQFATAAVRGPVFEEMAEKTFEGLENFFNK